MKKVVVLGASGQVGRAASQLLTSKIAIPLTRSQADLRDIPGTLRILERFKPDAVINAAAYTQVDLAEQETDLAYKVNADAPGKLAHWCAKREIPFVHFSTDYVFSGKGNSKWKEDDEVCPVVAYGRTKLDGERAVQEAGGDYLIFRTSWVYDAIGRNFLKTILGLIKEKRSLRVVNDQYGAPTFAPDLVKGVLRALVTSCNRSDFPRGIYHLCNEGEVTWFGFAKAIFEHERRKGTELKAKTIEPISSSEFPGFAKRPLNSRLATEKIFNILQVRLPQWEESLRTCLRSAS